MQHGYRAVLGHPSVVLSNNSRAGADDYADWLDIAPASIEVIHNGIDFEQLAASVDPRRTQEVRSGLRIPSDAPIVGSAFRMSEEKRPLLWVEVAAEIARADKRVHFVVYGEGPMRNDMLRLAERKLHQHTGEMRALLLAARQRRQLPVTEMRQPDFVQRILDERAHGPAPRSPPPICTISSTVKGKVTLTCCDSIARCRARSCEA